MTPENLPAHVFNPAGYQIVLVQPPDYTHSQALSDVGRLLQHSFTSLGLDCAGTLNDFSPTRTNIVLGYHLLDTPEQLAGAGPVVLYQLEQLSEEGAGLFGPVRRSLLKAARAVWDYSRENIAYLQKIGLKNVHYLPLGYHEKMRTFARATQDIDVLFYGSMNDRRRGVLREIARDCRVVLLFDVYGSERDTHIARAKIVLNIHYHEAQILEQVRLSYLLNNGCFVVSENSAINPYEGGLVTGTLDELPALCRHYLNQPRERYQIARRGYDLLKQFPMTDHLRRVLSES